MKISRLLPLLAVGCTVFVLGALSGANRLAKQATTTTATRSTAQSSSSQPQLTRGASTGATLSAQTAATTTCTTGVTLGAVPFNLASAPTGLSIANQATGAYTVYGNDVTAIRKQIQQCSPVKEDGHRYAASTEYALNWSYTIYARGDGVCTINNARVGLAVSQTYPQWLSSSQSNVVTANEWNRFIANLHIHEDGHTALNKQYAEKLITRLQNSPAESCATIANTTNGAAQAIVTELETANENYDQRTNHGQTQGAVL